MRIVRDVGSRLCDDIIPYNGRSAITVYRQRIIIDLFRTKLVGACLGLENTYFPIKSLRVI